MTDNRSPIVAPRPRERDEAEARQLFAQARHRGCLPLPQLTDLDLCVFADSFFPVLEDDVWRRWMALGDAERTALADRARAFLVRRALLRATGDGDHYVQPKLAVILTTRGRPAFTGICSVPGRLRADDLRLFGLRDEEHEPMVLLERGTARGLGEFGQVRQYSLATMPAAAGVTADWLRTSFESDPGAAAQPRMVEVYWVPEGGQLTGERITLSVHDGQYLLTHTQGTAPVCENRPIGWDELAAYLAGRLRVAGR